MSVVELLISLLKNPIVLGSIAVALVWLLRKAKWAVDGPKAIWLTYVVALCIAIVQKLLLEGFPVVVTCALVPTNPPAFVVCVFQIIENVLAWSGVLFAAATVIYKVLRIKMLLGERI
ncbi:MAG: hypothetical protein E3J42_04130 [Dehalococcoidia bacterium]|nr:MAG: hypothetical protein E3J42_04130 [Dehalococcoidia bacterium]